MYYTININGEEIKNVENTNPQTFKDVKVFAGEKFTPACDASYKNLNWKNSGKYKLHTNMSLKTLTFC